MILQFSKIPPPIGGVTIHVKRLVESLENENIEVLDYSKERNIFKISSKVFKSKLIHIHLGKKRIRLFFVLLFKMLGKKVVTTFHSKFEFDNFYDINALKLSNCSIVLNDISYNNALIHTRKIVKMGAFIAPKNNLEYTLENETISDIKLLKKNYKNVFCTNAWNVAINDKGEEVYCGSLLLETFNESQDIALVFSDPMGNYKKFLLEKYGKLPAQIAFVNYNHDFTEVINLCDAFIRATTTDGDSLSVKEALYVSKNVIASNVVERPKGCIIYNDKRELKEILNNFNTLKIPNIDLIPDDIPQKIASIYMELLKK